MSTLYADITGITNPLAVTITESHQASMTTASINCITHSLSIGDQITVDLGYTNNHDQLFRGYVKHIEKKVPNNTYTITAYDEMTRAIDFFIASSTPTSPFTRRGISAEQLVRDLMQLAGLAGSGMWIFDATHFVLGNIADVEINLVSVYDFCKMIADALTWSIWADQDGKIHFENRKPYYMDASEDPGQPGWDADIVVNAGNPFVDSQALDLVYRVSEKELRNRIVVYGGGVNAVAEVESAYLPAGFRKSVVAAFQWIDSQSDADKCAAYNLDLFNRLSKNVIATLIGDPSLHARNVYEIGFDKLSGDINYTTDGNWYAYSCEHNWNSNGYNTILDLRKGILG